MTHTCTADSSVPWKSAQLDQVIASLEVAIRSVYLLRLPKMTYFEVEQIYEKLAVILWNSELSSRNAVGYTKVYVMWNSERNT